MEKYGYTFTDKDRERLRGKVEGLEQIPAESPPKKEPEDEDETDDSTR